MEATDNKEIRCNGATRKELLSLPHRDWDNCSRVYDSLMVLADGRMHGSGWGVIAIIGCRKQKPIEIISQCSDDISWHINHPMRTDCAMPSRAMHFWTNGGEFRTGSALSSINVYLSPRKD